MRVSLTWENTDCLDLDSYPGRDTLKVKRTSGTAAAEAAWSKSLLVKAEGAGTVAHAGVVLPRLLADRVGLTGAFRDVLARRGFRPGRDRGRAVTDTVAALASGARCLSDVEAMTAQVELFGPAGGASDTTVLRVLGEYADRLGEDGLAGRALARATAKVRSRAWEQIVARHGRLPAVRVAGKDLTRPGRGEDVPVLVIRLDATVIAAASAKEGAEANYKGFGFHPLTAWCSNTGENLAMMNRVGSAGSFTAADHVKVLDAALAQVPAAHRREVLVSVDGAGASHGLVEHLDALNTAGQHGRRGRGVEYSIGWPVDARTRSAIEATGEGDWSAGLTATGGAEEHAQVVELTGLLRHSHTGDLLSGWPGDMRIFARRTPRSPGEQAQLGQDPNWRYGAFATNTPTGQVQHLDVRHRTQAHVEDRIKELKACGATRLPSTSYDRNSAWLHLAAHAVTVLAWLRLLALEDDLAVAEPKALRFRLLSAPARYVRHARKRVLKIPTGWAWATHLADAFDRLRALHPA
ncbi:IS1380 family transposase [Ornithinimicrobium avium]|uniref:IS1380 family transposase n=1 Tax=Ornithinimicrobium avium TaxID=2283195 RepID=A0A345NIM3_9MICO|nr:IS1380 family transposase [Ornithinimicrobium avium]AXH94881.1 IS1380 family transposase [Ornithinimicrobium avium]AXH96623.1 IS1380 family transposase [Ornithinimicrobium avium]AXH97403.1 IS1380 family transposase [Ornithinimicrobium avium]AXH97406.1 IS1380 family transposase [Ornithinimicrobium avium]